MIKSTEIDGKIKEEKICDTCGTNLDTYGIMTPPIKVNLYLVDYDFCSIECAMVFLRDELTK